MKVIKNPHVQQAISFEDLDIFAKAYAKISGNKDLRFEYKGYEFIKETDTCYVINSTELSKGGKERFTTEDTLIVNSFNGRLIYKTIEFNNIFTKVDEEYSIGDIYREKGRDIEQTKITIDIRSMESLSAEIRRISLKNYNLELEISRLKREPLKY